MSASTTKMMTASLARWGPKFILEGLKRSYASKVNAEEKPALCASSTLASPVILMRNAKAFETNRYFEIGRLRDGRITCELGGGPHGVRFCSIYQELKPKIFKRRKSAGGAPAPLATSRNGAAPGAPFAACSGY